MQVVYCDTTHKQVALIPFQNMLKKKKHIWNEKKKHLEKKTYVFINVSC